MMPMLDLSATLSAMPVLPSIDRTVIKLEISETPGPLAKECQSEEARKQVAENIKQVFLAYKGWREQEVDFIWDGMERAYKGLKPRNPGPYKYNYVIREIFRQVETLKPQLAKQFFNSDQLFRFEPRHAGFESQAAAATSICHDQIRRYNMVSELRSFGIDSPLLYGVGYLTYGWRRYKHVLRKIKPMHDLNKKKWWKRETEEVDQACPYLEALHPRDVYVHPNAEDPRYSPAVFVRRVVSLDDLKTLVREGWLDAKCVEKVGENQDGSLAYMSLEEKHRNYDRKLDRTPDGEDPQEMLICWTNDGWEYVLINRQFLVRGQRLEDGVIPILAQRNYPQMGEHYGIPEPFVILDDQRILNDMMSMFVDSYHITCNPMFKVKRGDAEKAWKMTTFRPGGHVVVNDINDIVPFDAKPTDMNLAQNAQFILRNMKLSTGVTDELAGAGSQAKTATGLVRLQDAAGARMEDKVARLIPGYREAYKILYNLNANNLDEEVAARLEGDDGVRAFRRYGPEVFSPDVDVEVVLSNMMESSPELMNKWQSMFQMMNGNPMVEQTALIERVFRAMGEKKPKMFLSNPVNAQGDALEENGQWKNVGVLPDPKPSDNHQVHLQIHQMQAASSEAATKDPMWVQELQRHIALHQAYLAQMQQSQAQASQTNLEPEPQGMGMPEADARTNAMFDNGQTGAEQQGAMMQ